jgi:flagellar protein FlbD
MIELTRMDGKSIMLNADWIQSVESTPDTLITLTTGFKLIVKDTVEQVVSAFKRYKREVALGLHVVKGEAQ